MNEYRIRFACTPTVEAVIQTCSLRYSAWGYDSAFKAGQRSAKAHRRLECCDGTFWVEQRVIGEWGPVELTLGVPNE